MSNVNRFHNQGSTPSQQYRTRTGRLARSRPPAVRRFLTDLAEAATGLG